MKKRARVRLRGKGELRRQRGLLQDPTTGAAEPDHTDLGPSGRGGWPDSEPGADSAAGPVSRGTTIGIRRLVVIAVVAAVAFGLATVSFADPSDRDCTTTMRGDRRYAVELEGPYEGEHDHPTYRLTVTKRGKPLDPRHVCLTSFPGGVLVVVDESRRAHIHIEREAPVEEDAPAG